MKVESSNLVDLWIFGDFMQTLQDLKKSEKSCEKCWRHHAATPNSLNFTRKCNNKTSLE